MVLENHLTFRVVFGNFLTIQSIRPKMFIPVFETFTAFLLSRFCAETRWAEKKMISYRPIWKFRQKFRIKAALKVENDGETL